MEAQSASQNFPEILERREAQGQRLSPDTPAAAAEVKGAAWLVLAVPAEAMVMAGEGTEAVALMTRLV